MTNNKKPNPRGRPILPEKEKRSVLLQFRVTERQAVKIRKDANSNNQSLSDWLRLVSVEA